MPNYKTVNGKLQVKGNLISPGVPEVINYGHIYSTSPSNLTTNLSTKTSLGERGTAGEFTSSISGLKDGTHYYVRPYAVHALGTFYGDTMQVRMNANPEIIIEQPTNNTKFADDGEVLIKGKIRDKDGDNINLTVELGGVTKALTIEGPNNFQDFEFIYNVQGDMLGQGLHKINLTADDGQSGVSKEVIPINITTSLNDGVYVLKDTEITSYPAKLYTDAEDHVKYQEQYNFNHDPDYYTNNQGIFPRHKEDITLTETDELPINTFSHVGKYELDYRARDNPLSKIFEDKLVFLEAFFKWSDYSIDGVTFYVHRRPVADFIVQLEAEGALFKASIKDYSYDLDNMDKDMRGLSQIQYRYRPSGDADWIISEPLGYSDEAFAIASFPAGKYYDIAVRVRDIDGADGLGEWSTWEEKKVLINTPPKVGFTVVPEEGPRQTKFTIALDAGVGNADYKIIKNRDFSTVLTKTNSPSFTHKINSLESSRDYYTVRQSKTVSGVTAEAVATISVYNRIPVLSNLTMTKKVGAIALSQDPSEPSLIDSKGSRVSFNYNDADGDIQERYLLGIYKDESLVYASNDIPGANTYLDIPMFAEDITYKLVVQAYDGFDWSDKLVGYFEYKTNRPPVAGFDIIPNPTDRLTNTRFESTAYDPDGDDLTYVWSWMKEGGSWSNFGANNPSVSRIFSEIDYDGQEFKVRQIVTDPEGLTDELIKTVLVKNLNPEAGIILPSCVLYEGDTWTFLDASVDPEGDLIIAHNWELQFPSGEFYSSTSENYTLRLSEVGKYYIRKQVQDSLGAWSDWTDWLTFDVEALSVQGFVLHTDLWDQHRIDYNISKSGVDFYPRSPDVFFPGEKFVLEAETTKIADNSCTSPIANNVIVELIEHDYSASLTGSNNRTVWDGSLWDNPMLLWRDQTLSFKFTAKWSNGTIKTDTVKVKINDDPYWRQRKTQ